jgi:outer membrane protein OmpA-like peptidoglycan-associated protein
MPGYKNNIHKYLLKVIFFLFLSISIQSQNESSVKIIISNIGKSINSKYPDYAPVVSADGLLMVFTSRRPLTQKENEKNKELMENVYISYYNEDKKNWNDAKIISAPVNQLDRHNSAIALSNDGQKMLLYRDDENGNGDIYESILKGDNWTEPVKLPKPINSEKHESSASISPDGRTIYFVSDRKGGLGGRDIWLCRQSENGKWGKAENLGKIINTTEDEEGVFIHPDGKTIYFSSKGHKGKGGYDIFKSVYENEQWNIPENIGNAINTTDDDIYFVLTANGKTGYYASSKKGGQGDKDIYKVDFLPIINEKEIGVKKDSRPKLTLFKGVVIDNTTSKPIESDIDVIDNEKHEVIARIKSNSVTGKFLISLPAGKNYGITVKKEAYLFYSENFNLSDTARYQEVNKIIPLKKIEIGNKITLKNIFYDFDKSTLRSISKFELDQLVELLNTNPDIKIEISSYTDNKGTDEYNSKLSQARAQSVVDYLVSKSINKDRLVAKGYGELQVIATNDTEEGRQLNRRTEFKILAK